MNEILLNALRLPGRIPTEQAAELAGFSIHDFSILVEAGLIRPLGKPAPNAPKYWSSAELMRLCTDRQWLDRATKAVSAKWKQKNEAAKTREAHETGP